MVNLSTSEEIANGLFPQSQLPSPHIAMGAARAYMAQLTISGVLTLLGVNLKHDDISFVLYRFMC